MEKSAVYSEGGSENSVVGVAPAELIAANKGEVVKVRK